MSRSTSALTFAALWWTAHSFAAQPILPTDAEIRNAPVPKFPTAKELQNAPSPSFPVVPAARAPNVDIGNIADRYQQMQRGSVAALSQGDLFVFVSFTIPPASFERILTQAERAGAVLVLRGLHENSMLKTAKKAQALIGTRKVAWQIDPSLYASMGVTAVPAVALAKPGAMVGGCKDATCRKSVEYGLVAGDVTLDYALDAIVQRKPALSTQGTYFLNKLRSPL